MSQKQRKVRGKMLFIYLMIILILLSLLTVATYTWFSLSRTPRVSDMNMYITTVSGLELTPSLALNTWVQQLDFRMIESVTAPLRPVTWSDERQCFLAANYGMDGRLMGYDSFTPLSDEYNANRDDVYGYYIKSTFYARSGEITNVKLSPAVEVDDGINGSGTYVIGTPLWDEQRVLHSDGGQGAEAAIRFGFRITYVDAEGVPVEDKPVNFFIYEPNCDAHLDDSDGYVPTPSIDGTGNLVDEEFLIRQTVSTWTEAYPVERSIYIKDLGEFEDEPVLFSLIPDDIVKIDLYVWLEGQDADCTNQIQEAQILANIQFAGDTEHNQSGLVPIG